MAEYDVLNFTNIDDKDFVGMWGGEEYLIKAGETKQFAAFLVEHFCKHLAKKILLRQGKSFDDETLREPLIKQMKGEVVAPSEEEPEEKPKAKKAPAKKPTTKKIPVRKEKTFPSKPKAKKRGKK